MSASALYSSSGFGCEVNWIGIVKVGSNGCDLDLIASGILLMLMLIVFVFVVLVVVLVWRQIRLQRKIFCRKPLLEVSPEYLISRLRFLIVRWLHFPLKPHYHLERRWRPLKVQLLSSSVRLLKRRGVVRAALIPIT